MATSDLNKHLAVNRYGDFELTSAIRPAPELTVVPKQGYRLEIYRDSESDAEIPMLAAAVSAERLYEVFFELLDQLSDVVDVILESHHQRRDSAEDFRDFIREHVDVPVLKSYFQEYKELLLEDGCSGVAIVDPRGPCEIQFDDHKVFVIYAKNLEKFSGVFDHFGIPRDDSLKLISEGEHLHSTCSKYSEMFEALRNSLTAE